MRLGTIRAAGRITAAVQDENGWTVVDARDVADLVSRAGWREQVADTVAGGSSWQPHDAVEVLRPILAPTKVICCGLNYRDHIAETKRDVPQFPTLFAKYADAITDPTASIDVTGSDQVDWEAELAVVIGQSCPAGSPIDDDAILGYTVANDVSMRDWQGRTLQWFQGKAWDRTTPLGPVIVTADCIDPRGGLEIGARIGDDVVQISNTRELVFDSLDLVAYISSFTSLSPGDIILTGTPGGVGLGWSPQRFLRDGEVLTTWIDGIGELRNVIRLTPSEAA